MSHGSISPQEVDRALVECLFPKSKPPDGLRSRTPLFCLGVFDPLDVIGLIDDASAQLGQPCCYDPDHLPRTFGALEQLFLESIQH